MRKVFVVITISGLFLLIGGVLNLSEAQQSVIDPRCVELESKRGSSVTPICNENCDSTCVYNRLSCRYPSEDDCSLDLYDPAVLAANYPEIVNINRDSNLFSVNFCPPGSPGPDTDPFCFINAVRVFSLGMFSLGIVAAIAVGVWAAWVRSKALDKPDEYERASKIILDAFWGIIILFSLIAIIQIVSTLIGLTGDIFSINILPASSSTRCIPDGIERAFGNECCSEFTHIDRGVVYCGPL